MVLQNKHKAKASYRYKKAHGIPLKKDRDLTKSRDQEFPELSNQPFVKDLDEIDGDEESDEGEGRQKEVETLMVKDEDEEKKKEGEGGEGEEEEEEEPEVDLTSFLSKQLSLSSSSTPLGFHNSQLDELVDDIDYRYVDTRNFGKKRPEILSVQEIEKMENMSIERKKKEAIDQVKMRLRGSLKGEVKKRKFEFKKGNDDKDEKGDLDQLLNDISETTNTSKITLDSGRREISTSLSTRSKISTNQAPTDDFLDSVLGDASGTFGRIKK